MVSGHYTHRYIDSQCILTSTSQRSLHSEDIIYHYQHVIARSARHCNSASALSQLEDLRDQMSPAASLAVHLFGGLLVVAGTTQ